VLRPGKAAPPRLALEAEDEGGRGLTSTTRKWAALSTRSLECGRVQFLPIPSRMRPVCDDGFELPLGQVSHQIGNAVAQQRNKRFQLPLGTNCLSRENRPA
jgi:hypothetical protein